MGNLGQRLGVAELKDKAIWRACVAEYFGNLLLNFFGCASCLHISDPKRSADVVQIAFTFGFVIFVTVQALCHVSGAHFNPAVTLTMALNGKTSLIRSLLYIVCQCAGAISGSAILKAMTPENDDLRGTLGLTQVSKELTAVQGFGVEFFLGFVLMLVVLGVCDDNRQPPTSIPAPLAIGSAVVLGHLAAVELTGASMNPARTFGSAIIANIWEHHWVYWLGPCLGSLTAGLIYRQTFAASKPPRADYNAVAEEKEMQRLDERKSKESTELPY